MDLPDRERLEKLVGMLGSSFDGERTNAARAIAAMAERHKLTITELVFGNSTHIARSQQPRRRAPQRETLDRLATIAARAQELEFVLTEWECQFSEDVAERYRNDYELSEKQLLVAEKIIRKVDIAEQRDAS